MRAVLDANVLVSGLLSRSGAPGRLIALWLGGAFELVISEALRTELERALKYPKVRKHVRQEDASEFLDLLRSAGSMFPDAAHPSRVSRDRGDDYVVALATASSSILVSGDQDLLVLAPALPILSPVAFLASLPSL